MKHLRIPGTSHPSINIVIAAGAAALAAGMLQARRLRRSTRVSAAPGAGASEGDHRFQSMAEHSPVGVYQLAPDRSVIYLNPAARAMVEVADDEIIPAEAFERFFTEESLETMRREHPKREQGIASTYELEIVGARGGRRSVLVSGAPIFDAHGQLESLIGTMTDVTEHAAATRAHREDRRFLATLIGNLPGYAYRAGIDEPHTLEFVSDGIVRLTGYHVDDFLQDRTVTLRDLRHVDDRDPFERQVSEAIGTRRAWDVTYRIATRYGEERWVHEQGRAVTGADGRVEAIEGFVTDITEEKRAQDDLRESERRLRTIIEHAPEAMVILDVEDDRFTDVNENAVKLFGRPREELFTLGMNAVSPPFQPDGRASPRVIADAIRAALDGRTPALEWSHTNAEGVDIPCEVRLVRLPSAERLLVRASITDIRERKRVEEQFLQSQKMESIGRLAGGVAHDFNNLMTAAIGYADLALMALPSDHAVAADVQEIRETATRAASLSQQLLAFSRRQVIEPRVLSLNDLVFRADRILRRLIGEDIDLVMRPGSGLGSVKVDPSQFEQVLINLVVNARDAMPRGGRITVETANVDLGNDYAGFHPETRPGAYVMLAVSDSGTGMSDEVRAHLFEPFFTTKPTGKGTGLGLATVYGVVKQAGGTIWVYSEPGHGSVFKIYLPRAAADGDEERTEERVGLPRGTETVLVVEDEPAVRNVAVRVLSELGYTIFEAANGAEALAQIERLPSPIDLLLTDVVMPQMGGKELADRISATFPEAAVLFTSGYTEDAVVRHGVIEHQIAYLQKPFSPQALAQKVRRTLDERVQLLGDNRDLGD